MDTYVCKSCGQEQPVDNYRKYYGGRRGRYRHCKSCEKLEMRRKYLIRRGDAATQEQLEELSKINLLYELRIKNGLFAPGLTVKRTRNASDICNEQLAKLQGGKLHEDV